MPLTIAQLLLATYNILNKCFEKMLQNRLASHLEANSCLVDIQHGFRPDRGADDGLLPLTDCISQRTQAHAYIISLDLRTAFPSVRHSHIVRSLKDRGIHGFLLHNLIRSLKGSQYYRVDGSSSSRELIQSGVKQGGVISPLLFLCAIDDLLRQLLLEAPDHGLPVNAAADQKILLSALAYADDIVLLAKDRTSAQHLCDICSRFAEMRAMQWHCESISKASKCEYMILNKPFGKLPNGSLVTESWDKPLYIHGRELNEVEYIKVLGVTIQNTLGSPQVASSALRICPTTGAPLTSLRDDFTTFCPPAPLLTAGTAHPLIGKSVKIGKRSWTFVRSYVREGVRLADLESFATPLLKQHQVVSNEEAWCLFTKRSYAFPWSKHINIRLSAVAASWHKLRLALAYRGAAMPSRNAWLLYDSLCASKLLYCSAIWWPGPGNQVATKAYTKQIGDHFRGVMKFIIGSHADQD